MKTGLHAARKALHTFGNRALPSKSTALGRALHEWRTALVADLGGSDVGFELPGLGVFHGPNLTPDRETGLGNWTDAQILAALQTGVRPDGRVLAPIMPWHAFAQLTKQDADAIVAFLRSLPPVAHKVPGPFGPTEAPTSFVMKIVPPGAK